ncbi:hypothetical protein ACFL59_11020 [Planctomycetota bacterium]
MKKLAVAVMVVLVLGFGASLALFVLLTEIDLTQYEHMVEPAIRNRPDEKVIQVVVQGETAKEAAGKAMGTLFRAYYGIDDVREQGPVAPKARWTGGLETPQSQWTGVFGMKVPDSVTALPDSVTALPDSSDTGEPTVELATWRYGEVAEILHIGPYSAEEPTVARLKAYIEEQGYRITGDHEEEYLKGPGMIFRGDPEGYHTIIRYPVARRPPAAEKLAERYRHLQDGTPTANGAETWDVEYGGSAALQIGFLSDSSPLGSAIGLQPGDIVISVNGRPVGKTAGRDMYNELKNETHFEIEIDRGGERKTLTYDLVGGSAEPTAEAGPPAMPSTMSAPVNEK